MKNRVVPFILACAMCSAFPLNPFNSFADGPVTESVEGIEAEGLIFSY